MPFAERAFGARRNIVRQVFWLCTLIALLFSVVTDNQSIGAPEPENPNAPAPRDAQRDPARPEAPPHGYLIRIELPIDDDVDVKVKRAVSELLGAAAAGGQRPVLILELWSGQSDAGTGSKFSRAMDLAKLLASPDLARVKTVAYIPKTIKGHAVLVALACSEIVMSPEAEIGAAGIDEQNLTPTIRSFYKDIAESRRTIPVAIALGMLDRDVKVFKVSTEVGTDYVLEEELARLKRDRLVQGVEELKPQPLLVDGRRARQELGFASYLADSRADVARVLKLPMEAVQDNPALAGGWRPVQVNIKRPIRASDVNVIQRKIEDQVRKNDANLIVILIESDGGSYEHSLRLATFLATRLEPSQVRTVAYIPDHARGDAAIIALACDQIVMNPRAKLGGEGADNLKADEVEFIVKPLREILAKKSRSWSVPAAMLDPELKVYRFTQKTSGQTAYFSDEEAAEQPDADSWTKEALITGGGPLQISGEKADEMGVAWKLVDNFGQFKQVYGLEGNLGMVEPGWADSLIEALASPGARTLLLVLAFAGLYLEINTPGIGLGGFIALVAFLLYFWAQHLQGTAEVLEVMLFLVGAVCLALEIFVIPGFGIFGLGGGLLMIVSLVLASQTFVLPGNEYQLEQMRNSLLVLAGTVAGCVAIATVMRRLLPRTPLLNRMMLAPPSGAELESLSQRESLVDLAHLLGQDGVATTRLILSGKARFGDELVDVIADGEPIDRGMPVTVVEVSGSRVVVRLARTA